jgi:hypothetical protein
MLVGLGGPLALVQVGLALLVLIGVAVWMRARLERRGADTRVVRLTPEHAVHVVELEGRTLLLGTGPSGAPSLLDTWTVPSPAPDEITAPQSAWADRSRRDPPAPSPGRDG